MSEVLKFPSVFPRGLSFSLTYIAFSSFKPMPKVSTATLEALCVDFNPRDFPYILELRKFTSKCLILHPLSRSRERFMVN